MKLTSVNFSLFFALLLAGLLLPFMLTNDSIWIDEGGTAMYAAQPDFHSWWHHLGQDNTSDSEMPLTMFMAWIAAPVLGTAEWQMRAVNLLWGALAMVGMYRVGRRIQMPWLPLLLAIQPYFWFYMNEARPYALQIACGTWLLAAFVEFIFAKAAGQTWAWLLAGSVFFLFLTTMLAPVTVAAVVLAGIIIAFLNRWKPERKALLVLLAGAVANLPAAIYYLTTLLRGAKGSQLWHVDLKFFGYVLYEFTGMTGLGLPTEEIRELARSPHIVAALAAHWWAFALPVFGFVLVLAVIFFGLRRPLRFPSRLQIGLLIILGLTAAIFVAGSLALQKAFWARHFAPVFPFYVILLGMAMTGAAGSSRRIIRVLPFLLCGLLMYSDMNLRFATAWRKENYRAAAQFARQSLAENKSIWWLAAPNCAIYYKLQTATNLPELGKVFAPLAGFGNVDGLPLPDVIIYSKPDINDPGLAVHNIITQSHYGEAIVLKSFTIWTNAP
ncbi:MAG TPA: hypothetical protein VIK35_06690 [Verrucomicrobiae bacterium]